MYLNHITVNILTAIPLIKNKKWSVANFERYMMDAEVFGA